ncbi:MAG: DUF3987 domain-containing protein [Pseudomonadota bacterium]
MNAPDPIPFVPDWPEPDNRLLSPPIPPAPHLPLEVCLNARLAAWVRSAAQAKGAPDDYVFSGLLAVCASCIGNSRWVTPWSGWAEPSVVWIANIGLPSAGKTPALQAVVKPLEDIQSRLRKEADEEREIWAERAEVAKMQEAAWRDEVRAAIKSGETTPTMPSGCDPGEEPHAPRLVIKDSTIEKLGAILSRQPRGTLQFRDELSGWLEGMPRYSSGSDRPFWLEAFNGQGYVFERIGRDPVAIERLAASVLGGIQPDRLKTLLFKADDDGLLSRMAPIWPAPAPISRPGPWTDEGLIGKILERLYGLKMVEDETGETRPWLVPFSEPARDEMDKFRILVREWETDAEGLLLSFIGKMPGLCARLALILTYLDWATTGDGPEPAEISAAYFGKAAHLIEAYLLPMASRSYSSGSIPKAQRSALALVALIRENRWRTFTSREVTRSWRQGLKDASEINPAISILEDGDCIKAVAPDAGPKGGRPVRSFLVNPALHGGQS